MARTVALARNPNPPIIVMPARRSVNRRTVRTVAKRAARRVGRTAKAHGANAGVLAGAAALGYAQAKGMLNAIPTIGGSRAMTIGIAGYALTRLSGSPGLKQLGYTAMLIGAFDFGGKMGGGKSSLEGDVDDVGEDEI